MTVISSKVTEDMSTTMQWPDLSGVGSYSASVIFSGFSITLHL